MVASEPARILLRDHEVMRQLLHALDGMAGAMSAGFMVRPEDAACALRCLRTFAQSAHAGKERRVLFPALLVNGDPAAVQVIAEMESMQAETDGAVAEMTETARRACEGDARFKARFEAAARRYVPVMNHHLHVEEAQLLPLVENAFGKAEGGRVCAAFEEVEADALPGDDHHQFAADIHGLAVRYARFAMPHHPVMA